AAAARLRRAPHRRPAGRFRLGRARRARPRRRARPPSGGAGARPSRSRAGGHMTVVSLAPREERGRPRTIAPDQWQRFERNLAETLAALGMDLDTPGTRDTPRRLLEALYDTTAGYDGDPKLRTAFPAERPAHVDGAHGQIVEGPIAFFSLC